MIHTTENKQVIVLGASVAGLLTTAALLSSGQHVSKVILLEKDNTPEDCGALAGRQGTPQDEHIHFMLEGGRLLIEDLVPGFTEKLIELGARPTDRTQDCHWFRNGTWKVQYENGTKLLFGSRMIVDRALRCLLLDRYQERMEIKWNAFVKGLEFTKGNFDVCGVKLRDGTIISTRLVVDCLGISSPVDRWLGVTGMYDAPQVDTVNVDLAYTSQLFKFKRGDLERFADGVFCYPDAQTKRGGGHMRINRDAVPQGMGEEGFEYSIVTLFGFQNEKPKCHSHEEFMGFAQNLNIPELYEILSLGSPLHDRPKAYPVPDIRWKRYDRLAHLPKGLVMLGDSVCRLDPTHAQGMTSAARQATLLKDLCHQALGWDADTSIQRELAKVVRIPFLMNAIDGNKFANTTGYKPPLLSTALWFLERAFDAAQTEPKVFSAILRVANLECCPTKLLRPDVLFKILFR